MFQFLTPVVGDLGQLLNNVLQLVLELVAAVLELVQKLLNNLVETVQVTLNDSITIIDKNCEKLRQGSGLSGLVGSLLSGVLKVVAKILVVVPPVLDKVQIIAQSTGDIVMKIKKISVVDFNSAGH